MLLNLPDVTLCAVDTRAPSLALAAMARCMAAARFGHAVLLTDAQGLHAAPTDAQASAGILRTDIGAIRSSGEYSRWILGALPDHVPTAHVLIVQWDGFIAHATAWTPEFLHTDYLGAPWKHGPNGWVVGNGGFSLRSARLMKALRHPKLQPLWHHPEDICIAHTLRAQLEQEHGIVFASPQLASRFAFENHPPAHATFGFHGVFNWPRVLPADELTALVRRLPDDVAASRDGFKLARALLQHGHAELARALIEQGRARRKPDWRWKVLELRCRLA